MAAFDERGMVAFEGRNLPGKHFVKGNVSIVCTRARVIPFLILNSWNTGLVSTRFISLYLHRDLRADSEKTTYLKKVKSHYNYRLIPPEKNLVTKEDCEEVNGFEEYLDRYEDQTLGCTITEAKRGGLYWNVSRLHSLPPDRCQHRYKQFIEIAASLGYFGLVTSTHW